MNDKFWRFSNTEGTLVWNESTQVKFTSAWSLTGKKYFVNFDVENNAGNVNDGERVVKQISKTEYLAITNMLEVNQYVKAFALWTSDNGTDLLDVSFDGKNFTGPEERKIIRMDVARQVRKLVGAYESETVIKG